MFEHAILAGMRGKFITFEGGEGCGKSTQIGILAGRLRAEGKKVLVTREPGGTRLCEKIRALLREEFDDPPADRAELLLFLASRAQLVGNVIRPALERGEWVLSDRFCDSTFAYQGYGRGLDLVTLKRINDFATEGLAPDLTLLLDLPPETSGRRLAARRKATSTSADRIELAGDGFHRRLREGFLALAKAEPERFAVIDAARTVEETAEAVGGEVRRRLCGA